jgi:hypothetical protein
MEEPIRVDPELQKVLNTATIMGIRVELSVLFRLRPETAGEMPSLDKTQELASTLVARVVNEVGANPTYVRILMPSIFSVRASGDFVRKMIEQMEIASAVGERMPPIELLRFTASWPPHSRRNGNG